MPIQKVLEYSFPTKKEPLRHSPDPKDSGAMYQGYPLQKDVYDKYFILKPKDDGTGTYIRIEVPPNWARVLTDTAQGRGSANNN
jgi:hypothetical protein